MQPDIVPTIKKKSDLDFIKEINSLYIMHLEPMGYKDKSLPFRMLRYMADILEYRSGCDLPQLPVIQAVIFFFEQHDNGAHQAVNTWKAEKTLDFHYRIINVWEIDPDEIIRRGLAGLYPLLPLMKHKADKPAEDIVMEAIHTIQAIQNPVLQADLLSVMSVLTAEKFSKELVEKFIRREQLMQSALFQDWVKEFVDEAEEKGKLEGKLEDAAEMLREGDSVDRVARIIKFPVEKIQALKQVLDAGI
jgi:predicted transposase/invertase (TIGR01784 family)